MDRDTIPALQMHAISGRHRARRDALRESTGTSSWEKAGKILARKLTEHDPVNKPLFDLSVSERPATETKTIAIAVEQFLKTKRGENIIDMAHYEGFFDRELSPWCKEQGLFDLAELGLEQVTNFRNQLTKTARSRIASCRGSAPSFLLHGSPVDRRESRQKMKPANEEDLNR